MALVNVNVNGCCDGCDCDKDDGGVGDTDCPPLVGDTMNP